MSWLWILPALATLGAVVILAASLRRVADEARALNTALATWDRMAVAIGDLEHDAERAERDLRRLTRR